MTKMTPKLQEAYNEWLLRFGFREVDDNTVIEANTLLDNIKISYEDWYRCLIYTAETTSYKLRTLAEIEIYDKNNK